MPLRPTLAMSRVCARRFRAPTLPEEFSYIPSCARTYVRAIGCTDMTQPFTPDDLHLHRRVADIDCCARSNEAACTVRSVDRENDAYVSHIWCFPLDGSAPRQITQGGSDDMPRWSPGGERLAFLSGRSGSPQVHLIARDGGEARQLSHLPQSVSSLRWGPGGEYLVVASAVEVEPDLHGARPGSRQAPPKTGCMPEVAW